MRKLEKKLKKFKTNSTGQMTTLTSQIERFNPFLLSLIGSISYLFFFRKLDWSMAGSPFNRSDLLNTYLNSKKNKNSNKNIQTLKCISDKVVAQLVRNTPYHAMDHGLSTLSFPQGIKKWRKSWWFSCSANWRLDSSAHKEPSAHWRDWNSYTIATKL